MKQVLYPKATTTGDISVEKGKPEANRYEFAATAIERLPIPFSLGSVHLQRLIQITMQLDVLSHQLTASLPSAVSGEFPRRIYGRL